MEGKQVLLTGGTGGLGLGVTPEVVKRGAKVTIPYRDETEVKRLKDKLSPTDFEKIRFVKANLLEENVVKQLVNDLNRVDVLIHLVGGFSMGKTHKQSYEDWKSTIDLNLNSTFLLCKYCLGAMYQSGYGRIVTVGSRGAVQPDANLGSYCASKAGVVALTQSIAEETKELNITANSVLPSVIDTPANREAMGDDNVSNWVSPHSLAQVICFLASEAAKDIRGSAIPVYGQV
ncbi:3-oxoacyl-ACP reductase FabG [Crocosphaera subtropica]|nr:3-oxoacyl-ACP reductase FabG [Crocosphaera subtropica]